MKKTHAKLRFGFIFFVVFLVFCGGTREQDAAAPQKTIVLEIPPGAGSKAIAQKLKDYGLIRSRHEFQLRAKVLRKEHLLKAGEYEFTLGMREGDILRMLVEGRVLRHRITIPEGLTYREIATLFAEQKLASEKAWIALCEGRDFLSKHGIPHETVEGYLFPSTYFFSKTQTEEDMILEMIANHRKAFTPDLRAKGNRLGLSDYQILTLASIIEKETGKSSERPIISSVFHNRLQKKMRLQSDPTTIYGIRNFNGNLTKRDLQTPTPYNTYAISGLPKGPICNVGREAMEAAVNPAQTNYLYFVSRNDGSHLFSTNFKDHDRAVTQFQKSLLQKKKR